MANGYATSDPSRGYDYQWSGDMPASLWDSDKIVAVWYDDDPGERPEWTLHLFYPED